MASEEFPAFELIPAEPAAATPDEELAELDIEVDDSADPAPIGYSWQLDFDTGQFARTPLIVRGEDAVVMVAQVALRTRRGMHPIFDDDFGMEDPDSMLGFVDEAERRATYVRDTTETLLACHERITDVSDFTFLRDADDEIAYVDLTIEIDGDDEIRLEGVPLV